MYKSVFLYFYSHLSFFFCSSIYSVIYLSTFSLIQHSHAYINKLTNLKNCNHYYLIYYYCHLFTTGICEYNYHEVKECLARDQQEKLARRAAHCLFHWYGNDSCRVTILHFFSFIDYLSLYCLSLCIHTNIIMTTMYNKGSSRKDMKII